MGRERIIHISSPEETISLGKIVATHLPKNSVVALSGDLGAGKTTFVQGLALGLGINCPIQSPTFVFFTPYFGTIPLYHFDLYRMKSTSDFLGLGFEEYFDCGGICAIEWPERISPILPQDTISISIKHSDKGRTFSIAGNFTENTIDSVLKWD